MATYLYNGKILIKNSRREDYKFACIHKTTGEKLQISSTKDGANKERERRIAMQMQEIRNYKNALRAVEKGEERYFWKAGSCSGWSKVTDYQKHAWEVTDRELTPTDYYNKHIARAEAKIKCLTEDYEVVEIEKR